MIELAKEIEYQKEYSYEQRVDFFNKYSIPTTLKAFNPIYELGKFICSDRSVKYWSDDPDKENPNINYGIYNSCYSHSGAVLSNFNKEIELDKTDTVIIRNNTISLRAYDRSVKKMRPFLKFNLDSKTITSYHGIIIKRNLYDKIDEWLFDFGYQKWN